MTDPTAATGDSQHADNQSRFREIERKLDDNTAVTKKLAEDTAELVEMWRDAGVFFKWMRRAGSALVTLSKWALAIGGLYAAWKQWWSPK